MDSITMIRELATAFGPPGFEDEVIELARKYVPDGVAVIEDSLRNLFICPKNDERPELPTVLIDAHSDEVGLMVQAVNPNGTLVFIPLGDWVASSLPSQKVSIRNLDGELIQGVVATRPPHFGLDNLPLTIPQLVIDIGAISQDEVEQEFKITPGCPIAPYTNFSHDPIHDIMMSKAFDCRLGCAAVLEVLHELNDLELGVNVIGSLSSQEEIGMRGIRTVANRVKPDIAICFEGSPADDTLEKPHLAQTKLKKGPMLRHIDEGMVTHPRFIRYAIDLAKELHIPVQEAVRTGGKTNGSSLHLANNGIPTIVIGLPVRYVHSHNSIASFADYKRGVQLASEIIKNINADIISQF